MKLDTPTKTAAAVVAAYVLTFAAFGFMPGECDCQPTPQTDANYPPDVQGPFLATIESCADADWLNRSPIVYRNDHYASDSIWSSCQAAFEDCELRGQRCCDSRVEFCDKWGEPIND